VFINFHSIELLLLLTPTFICVMNVAEGVGEFITTKFHLFCYRHVLRLLINSKWRLKIIAVADDNLI